MQTIAPSVPFPVFKSEGEPGRSVPNADRGEEGVQDPENFADVIYGRPLTRMHVLGGGGLIDREDDDVLSYEIRSVERSGT